MCANVHDKTPAETTAVRLVGINRESREPAGCVCGVVPHEVTTMVRTPSLSGPSTQLPNPHLCVRLSCVRWGLVLHVRALLRAALALSSEKALWLLLYCCSRGSENLSEGCRWPVLTGPGIRDPRVSPRTSSLQVGVRDCEQRHTPNKQGENQRRIDTGRDTERETERETETYRESDNSPEPLLSVSDCVCSNPASVTPVVRTSSTARCCCPIAGNLVHAAIIESEDLPAVYSAEG